MSPMQAGVAVLTLMLAGSLAANAWLFHERDKALAAEARTEQLERDTRAAAAACTASVDGLAKAGERRQRQLAAQLAQIAPTVAAYQAEAISSLRARPDDPKDLCGSLLRYWQGQIARERGGK